MPNTNAGYSVSRALPSHANSSDDIRPKSMIREGILSDYQQSLMMLNHPREFLDLQRRTLDDRLRELSLPAEDEAKIRATEAGRIIRDKGLGLFKIGELIGAFLTFNEKQDEVIRAAKKDVLLARYFERADKTETSVSALHRVVADPQGSTLLNKILRILDDSPPDADLIEHLSASLHYICSGDFASLFEAHKFALSIIERTSPQGLAVLSDHRQWPEPVLEMSQSSNGLVTSDWAPAFATAYAKQKGFDENRQQRLGHTVSELRTAGMMELRDLPSGHRSRLMQPTALGRSLLPYLASS